MKIVRYQLLVAWLVVLFSFILGVTLPIATVEKFIFFDNEFSLLGSILELLNKPTGQNLFLLLIIGLFTFIFPIFKIVVMLLQIINHGRNWQNKVTLVIEKIGHFSMLDVFIIALMVLLLKLRLLVDVSIHQGFYWFSFSIIFSTILSFAIKQMRY